MGQGLDSARRVYVSLLDLFEVILYVYFCFTSSLPESVIYRPCLIPTETRFLCSEDPSDTPGEGGHSESRPHRRKD